MGSRLRRVPAGKYFNYQSFVREIEMRREVRFAGFRSGTKAISSESSEFVATGQLRGYAASGLSGSFGNEYGSDSAF